MNVQALEVRINGVKREVMKKIYTKKETGTEQDRETDKET